MTDKERERGQDRQRGDWSEETDTVRHCQTVDKRIVNKER